MTEQTILIIDDEHSQRETLAGFLRKLGYRVETAASGRDGLKFVRATTIDCILTDFRMPDVDGETVLREVRQVNPDIPVVMITAYGSVEGAVAAMREGAFDYLTKPIDLDELEMIVAKAIERRALISENRELRRQLEEHHHRFVAIVSQSGAMVEVLSLVARVAPTKATILLRGESGTGKELIARAIHDAGPRHGQPFIAVNCAALPESLFESEFFGHEKGAFTGADRRRIGRFEEADGGTLFIDEIGDIPLPLQVKLLRTLQDGEFQRVGGNATIRVNVRIVAATNRDLEAMIAHGTFREDLYYRLNVVAIQVPLLRERKEDIPLLVEHFIAKYADENGKRIDGVSKEAMELLMRYDYPGNVRELENAIERAVVVTRERLMTSDDLPMRIRTGDRPSERKDALGSLDEMVEVLERRAIAEALEATGGNQTKAAQRLGITERNLRYKIKKYKLR